MFKNNFHILFVDGCYSSDKGNIFLAVFLDGNHMVQPIAFQICSVENNCNWTRFMKALYEAGVRDDDLVINSDRHQSISSAVSEVFPNAEHTIQLKEKRFFTKDTSNTEFSILWFIANDSK